MSPLPIRSVNLFPSRSALGVVLGVDQVIAAALRRDNNRWRVDWVEQAALSRPLNTGIPDAETPARLAEALGRVCRNAPRHTAVQVALPDPLMVSRTFSLESRPPGKRMMDSLVRLRFSKDAGLAPEGYAYTHQHLGREEHRHLVLASALDIRWRACLIQAFQQAGIWLGVLDAEWGHIHNGLPSLSPAVEGAESKRDGTLVYISPWSWSLIIQDAEARPRYVRSRWRDPATESMEELAMEVERTLRAYAQQGAGAAVFRVSVLGGTAEATELSTALNARLREPCVTLDPLADFLPPGEGGWPPWNRWPSVLLTALPR